jgi:hypothetical protein
MRSDQGFRFSVFGFQKLSFSVFNFCSVLAGIGDLRLIRASELYLKFQI